MTDNQYPSRFVDGGEECIEDQFLIDTSNDKYYWISYGLDDIVKLLNELHEENESLKEENKFLRNKVATYKSGNALLKKTLDKEWK